MHAHALGRLGRAPGPAAVLEGPDQFLLLGVDRDRRLAPSLGGAHLLRDVPKLRVAVGVLAAFARLDVALQAVAEAVQQFGDQRVADRVPERLEGDRERARAQARPAERRVRIAGRRRLDQRLQVLQQGGVEGGRPLPAPARATRPLRRQRRVRIGVELAKPAANRGGRDARGPRHLSDAAVTQGPRLGRGPEATRPLREHGDQRRMLGPKRRQRHGSPYHAGAESTSRFNQLLSDEP